MEDHYCYECGHFHYDTTMGMGGDDSCDCKEGYTYIRNQGETDCKYWKPKNHPDIVKKNKIDNFFHGHEKYPDMQFIYDNCFKEKIDKATYAEFQNIIISVLGKVYNSAVSRCYIAYRDCNSSFIECSNQSLSEYKGWKKEDELFTMVKMSCEIADKHSFEIIHINKYMPMHGTREECTIYLKYAKKDGRDFNQFRDMLLKFIRFIPREYSDRISFDMGDTIAVENT